MHFIREETLKRFVLRRIFDVTAMFFEDIMSFQKAVYEQRFEEAEKAAKKRKREIAQAEKRITELDRIFKRIYEDDINGKHREHRRREYQRQPVLPAEGAVRLHQLFQRFPADIGFQRIVVHRHEHYLNGADEHRQSDGENIGDYAGYLVGVLYGVLAYFHIWFLSPGDF